jgi:hypothetical protein
MNRRRLNPSQKEAAEGLWILSIRLFAPMDQHGIIIEFYHQIDHRDIATLINQRMRCRRRDFRRSVRAPPRTVMGARGEIQSQQFQASIMDLSDLSPLFSLLLLS